nr:hypothetical protein HAGR004_20150 [Bdellovibrio sp. HAGR004]
MFGGGDTNLFGYTANDPINRIDPTGLDSEIEIYDSGHAVLRVDDPSSSTGSSYIDFYPNGTPSWPFTVKPGVLDIDSSYGGKKRGSLGNCPSTPAEDKQILERAQNMSKNPPNYQTIPLGKNKNCYGAAFAIQGGCK